MRRLVPFVGEQKVVRADDDQSREKRVAGRVIDDVVGNGKIESSWDDVVPDGWTDKTKPKPMKPASSASVSNRAQVSTKPSFNPANSIAAKKSTAEKSSPSSAITFSDLASLDWVRINNGRGIRVSIYGNIDNDLRKEWSRLLNDQESSDVKEFEFNLNETPALSLTGLGMLLLFKERKGSARDAIKLCNCNKEVAELLQWTGMDKYFVIETTHIS